MKNTLSLLAAATLATASHVFYDLQLRPPGGVNITQFGGTLKVPEYPPGYPSSGEYYYLFPGAQSTNIGGIFQQVMSPQSSGGTWSIDSGYYDSTNGQPFQGGLSDLKPGDEIFYWNYDNGNGQWTTKFSHKGKPISVTDDWPHFQGLSFNIATWAIELYSAP